MKNIKVNLAIIEAMNPCKDRIDNYRNAYGALTFTLVEFLELDKITALDKQWVVKRLAGICQDFWITYETDCAVSASSYAAAYDAAYDAADAAAYAAAYAADAAYDAADAERENQIDALIYLLNNWN